MLLDEAPAELIHNCTSNFNTAPDRASLLRTKDSLSAIAATRSDALGAQQKRLREIQRRLATVQSQHSLSVRDHNPAEHAKEILRLDTEKFRIAKEASELEIEGERLEGEIEGVRGQLLETEAQGPEGGESARSREGIDDEILLRLKIYRSFPLSIEPDEKTGLYTRAVVRNRAKDDVRVVNFDPKFSGFFYTNYLWGAMA